MAEIRKRTFALIIASLLAATTLAGCSENQETAVPSPVLPNSITEVYATQIEQYEAIIRELEAELLLNKEEKYISDAEYSLRISELEESIKTLLKKLDSKPTVINPEDQVTNEIKRQPTSSTQQSDFEYAITDGYVTITRYKGDEAKVTIPSHIDGNPVASIGEGAFKGCELEEVVIPETITEIGWFAFADCQELQRITIPESVKKIGYGAFDNRRRDLYVVCESGSYAEAYAISWAIATVEN